MPLFVLAGAMVVGPYSGVSLDNLLALPHRSVDTVVERNARQVADSHDDITLTDDELAAIDAGAEIGIRADLDAGSYDLQMTGRAEKDTASCSVSIDGVPIEENLSLGADSGTVRVPIIMPESGEHTLTLTADAPALIEGMSLRRFAFHPPRAPMRGELVDTHPRLLITEEDIPRLRDMLDDPRVQGYYELPEPRESEPRPYDPDERTAKYYRGLTSHALAYLVTEDPEHLDRIVAWLDEAATYPGFEIDIDYEFMLEGVALTYDWLYDDLPEDTRHRTRDFIARMCRQMYEESIRQSSDFSGVSFQQNHFWYGHLALMLGAASIYGEVPGTEEWLGWAWDRAERIFLTFSPDGGFHEGAAYWGFSMPTLYKIVDLYEQCTGLDIPAGDDGLHGQSEFRFRHLVPGLGDTASMEDTPRWFRKPDPRKFMWEAKRYQDPVVMGMAELMRGEPKIWAFSLLWMDPELPSTDPRQVLDTAKYYPDIETIFARTDWSEDATYVTFVSRPMGGYKYAEICEQYQRPSGTAHNHPHMGHFMIHGRGETLADEPGHTYTKKTRDHNTILVNGQGQYGDGEAWPKPNPGRAHISGFVHEGKITIAAADPSSAYPDELGVSRFDRILVLASEDLVIVHDRLAAKEPSQFSWLLHHYGEVTELSDGWEIARREARLSVHPLQPADFQAETETYLPGFTLDKHDNTPEEAEVNVLRLTTEPVTEATFLVPMQVYSEGEDPPEITREEGTNCEVVRMDGTAVAFRGSDGQMSFTAPWDEQIETTARCAVTTIDEGENRRVELPAE